MNASDQITVAADNTEGIPEEILDLLPEDTVQQLRDGIIDKIPEDLVDALPPDLADRIPANVIEFASNNPTLTVILAIIGVLAVIGFVWGVMKSTIKVAVFSGVAAAVAWYFFFQQ